MNAISILLLAFSSAEGCGELGAPPCDCGEPGAPPCKLGAINVPGYGPGQNKPSSHLVVPGHGSSHTVDPDYNDPNAWAGTEGGRCIFGQYCFWGLRCKVIRDNGYWWADTKCVKPNSGFGGLNQRCIQSQFCDVGLECRRSQNHGGRKICLTPYYLGASQPEERLGSALLGHPASHVGAPTVTGPGPWGISFDRYCPHQCAIWAWNTDTQQWQKKCQEAGWTADAEYTYPNPMSSCDDKVRCYHDSTQYSWTQWRCYDGEGSSNTLGAAALPSTETNELGSALLGHPASHVGAPTVSGRGLTDAYCPHQCAIWAWNTDKQTWQKKCQQAGWTVGAEYTYPNPMSCDNKVRCYHDSTQYSWTQWRCYDGEGSSNTLGAAALPSTETNELGSALLGHPASHVGAPTVSGKGLTDAYCPHQCAIWAWNTDTQEWEKECVTAGWTVDGQYTYPNPMNYETVRCARISSHDGWTQWVGIMG